MNHLFVQLRGFPTSCSYYGYLAGIVSLALFDRSVLQPFVRVFFHYFPLFSTIFHSGIVSRPGRLLTASSSFNRIFNSIFVSPFCLVYSSQSFIALPSVWFDFSALFDRNMILLHYHFRLGDLLFSAYCQHRYGTLVRHI